jgi:poly(3-hydroxybutyrate) depolymerase
VLYTAYELNRRAGAPAVAASQLTAKALHALPAPLARTPAVRHLRAACDIVAKARPTHDRPEFGIDMVSVS